MEFEWDSLWLLFAILAGISPIIAIGARKAWKWYHKIQSGGDEDLKEHVARVEKESKK